MDVKPPKDKPKDASQDDQPPPDPDEVLRRMLESPPAPHKLVKEKGGPSVTTLPIVS